MVGLDDLMGLFQLKWFCDSTSSWFPLFWMSTLKTNPVELYMVAVYLPTSRHTFYKTHCCIIPPPPPQMYKHILILS